MSATAAVAPIVSRTAAVHPASPQGQVLRVVPIVGPSHDRPPYRTFDADAKASVTVTEYVPGTNRWALSNSNPFIRRKSAPSYRCS